MIGMNAMFIHLQPSLPNNTIPLLSFTFLWPSKKDIYSVWSKDRLVYHYFLFDFDDRRTFPASSTIYLNLLRGLFERASSAQTCMERRLLDQVWRPFWKWPWHLIWIHSFIIKKSLFSEHFDISRDPSFFNNAFLCGLK